MLGGVRVLTYDKIKEIPLIDTHVHRIHPDRELDFGTIGGGYIQGPNQEMYSRQTIIYHMMMEELRNEFKMSENADISEVEAERHRRCGRNPQEYYKNLMQSQNVRMYCVEIGSPLNGKSYSKEEIEYFNAIIPQNQQSHIVRIERTLEPVLKQQSDFDEMVKKYKDCLCDQINKEKVIGIKSCIAYTSGLNADIIGREDARKAYERIRQGKFWVQDEKTLNDYILLESADIAAEYDIPLQVHTGFGNGKYIDFKTLNPLWMEKFLKNKKVLNRVKVVLLHGGHPNEEEVSYLTAQFSNVYTDFSANFYLSSIKGMERMAALLERAPIGKVMYGSDGVLFPEMSWFSHIHFRRIFFRLLTYMVAEGYVKERLAEEMAEKIMYGNALECYSRLKDRI